jgi:hypothetical protein
VHVLVQALLEDPAAEIIRLAGHDLSESLTKLGISYARFAGRPSKDGGLESSRDILIGVSIQAVVGHAPR